MRGYDGVEHDARIRDWLEQGPQQVPEWLVNAALNEAHALPQLPAHHRLPWIRLRWRGAINLQRIVPLAAGAIGALAVLAAFILGIMSAPLVGNETPTPSPTRTPSPSPSVASPTAATPSPVSGEEPSVRALDALQVVNVMPDLATDFYTLIGLAVSRDAVWTVAVIAGPDNGSVQSRLVRIDATTGVARAIDIAGASGTLSPPVAQGETIWTGSDRALHAVDASGNGAVRTLPLDFQPAEISVGSEGLWVASDGGTTLVDPETGEVIRHIALDPNSASRRIVGAPAFGSLWACRENRIVDRIDPHSGATVATITLSAEIPGDCRERVYPLIGVDGLPDGVIPGRAGVVVDPATNTVAAALDTGASWNDAEVIGSQLWIVESFDVGQISLLEMDVAARRPARILTFDGLFHSNTAFDSEVTAVTGDALWMLIDAAAEDSLGLGPRVVRIPLAELDAADE